MTKTRKLGNLAIATSQAVVDHEAVAVEIAVMVEDDWGWVPEETFTGVSKCDPSDKFNPDLGYDLAFWRAVERAAQKNLKRLAGEIKHNDDTKAQKEQQKAQAAFDFSFARPKLSTDSFNAEAVDAVLDVIRIYAEATGDPSLIEFLPGDVVVIEAKDNELIVERFYDKLVTVVKDFGGVVEVRHDVDKIDWPTDTTFWYTNQLF